MATTKPIPETLLDERLPDWWRPLGVDLEGRVQMRRDAIADLAQALKLRQLVDAVAYAHGDTAAGENIIEIVRGAARAHDETFAGDVGDAEPAAMVAAALAHHLATLPDHRDSTVISQLVLSARWHKLKPVIDGQGLDRYAELQLRYAAAAARSAASVLVTPTAAKQVSSLLEGLEALPPGTPQLQEPQVSPHLTAHAEALGKLAGRIDLITRRMRDEQLVLREQLRVHAWLLEEWCASAEMPWTEVSDEAVPVLAAVELGQRTRRGEPAIDGDVLLASTIAKAGGDPNSPLPPLSAMESAVPIVAAALNGPPHERLFPMAAAERALRSGEGSASGRQRARKLVGARKRPALKVAEQVYRELMVLRMLNDE